MKYIRVIYVARQVYNERLEKWSILNRSVFNCRHNYVARATRLHLQLVETRNVLRKY